MNRREVMAGGLSAAALPGIAGAAAGPPLLAHVIRLGFFPGIPKQVHDQTILTINRFKQIKAPRLMIAGRDISAAGGFEFAQISLIDNEKRYYDYFYDPIHLAADREADNVRSVNRGQSFDVFPAYNDAVHARLLKVTEGRTARFKAKDTRPTAPPVADRPQDQRWSQGSTFYYVARFGVPLGTPAGDHRRAAFRALQAAAGSRLVVGGREVPALAAGQEGETLIIAFPGEAAYQAFLNSAAYAAAKTAGLFAADSAQVFIVADPADDALAARLKKSLAGA